MSLIVQNQDKAKYYAEKMNKSSYNFESYGGFRPESNPDMMFSCITKSQVNSANVSPKAEKKKSKLKK
jgi:hypothetical protein